MALNFVLIFCVIFCVEPLLSRAEDATTNAPPITPGLPGFANIDLASLSKSSAVLSANAAPKEADGSADFGAAATTPQSTTPQGPDCDSNNCTMDKSHMFEHRNNTHAVGGQKAETRKASQSHTVHVAVNKARAGNSTVVVKGQKGAVVSVAKPVVVVQ